MVQEARLEDTDGGLAPSTDGWFVVNLRDAAWVTNDILGFKSPLGTAVYGWLPWVSVSTRL